MKVENPQENVNGKCCPNCGQAAIVRRIDARYVVAEFRSLLFLEKGILFTIRELLLRPGKSIRCFIQQDRNRLVKPVIFIILTSLIYTLSNSYFPFEEKYINYGARQNSTMKLFQWVSNNYGYSNLIMGIFIAFWTRLFFRKYHYNFFEVLIVLCFVMGMLMLMWAIFGLFENLSGIPLMQSGAILSIIYLSWAIGQFFEKKIGNYLKSLLAYIIGFLSFTCALLLLGMILNYLSN